MGRSACTSEFLSSFRPIRSRPGDLALPANVPILRFRVRPLPRDDVPSLPVALRPSALVNDLPLASRSWSSAIWRPFYYGQMYQRGMQVLNRSNAGPSLECTLGRFNVQRHFVRALPSIDFVRSSSRIELLGPAAYVKASARCFGLLETPEGDAGWCRGAVEQGRHVRYKAAAGFSRGFTRSQPPSR